MTQKDPETDASPPPDTAVENTQTKDTKKQKPEDTATTIHIKVYSPYQVYYDDDAESISAENLTGPFDILPRHHNFITLLSPCELAIKSSSTGDKRIKISRGVMYVHSNKVTIFLDV